MTQSSKFQSDILPELRAFKKFFFSHIKTNLPLVNVVTRYILRDKGNKDLIPLIFLSAKHHGKITESTYIAASLIKLLHTASVVHDDVKNNTKASGILRGFKNLWQSKLAVLMGDYLLSRGLLLAIKFNEFQMLEIISLAVKKISESELFNRDISLREQVLVDDYLQVTGNKTASIMSASAICGALSAGGGQVEVERMQKLGYNFGIAYQIKADLSVFKKHASLKSLFNLPYIHALTQQKQGSIIQFTGPLENSERKEKKAIREFVLKHGSLAFAREQMQHYKNLALQELDHHPLEGNGELKEWIIKKID